MGDIEIKNLTAEELDRAANSFKNHVIGMLDNVRHTMESLQRLGEYWTGAKYNNCIKMWNERSLRLKQQLIKWDQVTNTMFLELAEQYKSVMIGDNFQDINLEVDIENYDFIDKPIEINANEGTFFYKEQVDRILSWDIEGHLENVAPAIRNITDILNEDLATGSSTALTIFKEKSTECANEMYNPIRELLDEFINIIKTRRNEIETIEERARMSIQDM